MNLDIDGLKRTAAKIENQELRDALDVVIKHLNSDPSEDRNQVTWGFFDDKDDGVGLLLGFYRF